MRFGGDQPVEGVRHDAPGEGASALWAPQGAHAASGVAMCHGQQPHLSHRPNGQPPLAAVPRRAHRQSLDCRHPLRGNVCPGLCPRQGWRAILAQRQADKGAQRAQQTVSHARPRHGDDCHIFYYPPRRVGDQVYDSIEDSRQVFSMPQDQFHEDWHRLGKPWI